LLRALEWYAP